MPTVTRMCETCERQMKESECKTCIKNKGYSDNWILREDFNCKCLRCGSTWTATKDPKTIKQCMFCGSRRWNVPIDVTGQDDDKSKGR